MQATARMYYQKADSKRTEDNLCPVKLCITHNRVRRYYSIKDRVTNDNWLYLSDSDIESLSNKGVKGKFKDIAENFKSIVNDAESIIKELQIFSFNQFEERFFNKELAWDNVFAAFWTQIGDLKAEGRFGYASSYESTLRAVKEFHTGKTFNFNPRRDKVETRADLYLKGKSLLFVDITESWLKRFEKSMRDQKKSKSTIGIYMRNIRVIFNLATKKHKVKAENPFNNYKIKSAQEHKKALTVEQIGLIANYETRHPQEQLFRDLFLFSFLGYGMNLSDIARLKYSNIDFEEKKLTYIREKTKASETVEVKNTVPITELMQGIIERYGNRSVGFDNYVFPILQNDWDEKRSYAAVKQLTKSANKYIGQIAVKVGIHERVTTYFARHSWATISKNSGKSIEFISEGLGHSSPLVTKRYLSSFGDGAKREHSESLERLLTNSVKHG